MFDDQFVYFSLFNPVFILHTLNSLILTLKLPPKKTTNGRALKFYKKLSSQVIICI